MLQGVDGVDGVQACDLRTQVRYMCSVLEMNIGGYPRYVAIGASDVLRRQKRAKTKQAA